MCKVTLVGPVDCRWSIAFKIPHLTAVGTHLNRYNCSVPLDKGKKKAMCQGWHKTAGKKNYFCKRSVPRCYSLTMMRLYRWNKEQGLLDFNHFFFCSIIFFPPFIHGILIYSNFPSFTIPGRWSACMYCFLSFFLFFFLSPPPLFLFLSPCWLIDGFLALSHW